MHLLSFFILLDCLNCVSTFNFNSNIDLIFNSLICINEDFKGCNYVSPIKLIDENNKICYFYKTYLNNLYTGYFILDNNYQFLISNTESIDPYPDIKDGYYFNNVFDISKERYENEEKINVNNVSSFSLLSNEELPFVNETAYKAYSSSFGSSLSLINVPTYYNGTGYDNFPGGGCTPTAGIMFLSFYDRNSPYYYNLYSPDLPLNHDDNLAYVNREVKSLGTYMKTIVEGQQNENNPLGSTKDYMIPIGINNYLNNKSFNNYKMKYVDTREWKGTKTIIDKEGKKKQIDLYMSNRELVKSLSSHLISKRTPAILTIDSNYSSAEYLNTNHAVVLTGYDSYVGVKETLRVNYGWKNRNSNYTISLDSVGSISYLYK